MKKFWSGVEFATFFSFISFFVSKAAPTKAKANKSKPLTVSLSSFCQDKSVEKISSRKKIKMISAQHSSNNGKNWQKLSYQKILLA